MKDWIKDDAIRKAREELLDELFTVLNNRQVNFIDSVIIWLLDKAYEKGQND